MFPAPASAVVIKASVNCAANKVEARAMMVITEACWREHLGRGFAAVGTVILKEEEETVVLNEEGESGS